MLKPDERAHLIELLRPPADCRFDCAVGTTFSLDLMSALMLPLSFALFDWEESDGELKANPLALLEALRRFGDRFTVFCQNGQIRLPSKFERILAFLEPCIYEVNPPDKDGVFHPKLWVLRFLTAADDVRYRVLCLSRNLTFDRCWDTVVALDGELLDRTNAISANRPLSNLVEALPGLTSRKIPGDRRRDIVKMSDELKRVGFEWPDGFEGKECRFWAGGLDGRAADPFGQQRGKSIIVSPFVSDDVVGDFLEYGDTHLVSRTESLDALRRETLQKCRTVNFLASEVVNEDANDNASTADRDEILDGLHAKLFVIDRGWDASVFTGSMLLKKSELL